MSVGPRLFAGYRGRSAVRPHGMNNVDQRPQDRCFEDRSDVKMKFDKVMHMEAKRLHVIEVRICCTMPQTFCHTGGMASRACSASGAGIHEACARGGESDGGSRTSGSAKALT